MNRDDPAMWPAVWTDDDAFARAIGRRAWAARTWLGLTPADAAARIAVTPAAYRRIERGQAMPTVVTLRRMTIALEVSAADLLASAEDMPWDIAEPDAQASARQVERAVARLREASPRTRAAAAEAVDRAQRAIPAPGPLTGSTMRA